MEIRNEPNYWEEYEKAADHIEEDEHLIPELVALLAGLGLFHYYHRYIVYYLKKETISLLNRLIGCWNPMLGPETIFAKGRATGIPGPGLQYEPWSRSFQDLYTNDLWNEKSLGRQKMLFRSPPMVVKQLLCGFVPMSKKFQQKDLTCSGKTIMKTFLSRSVKKFLKKVYPVPIRRMVPKRRAPFSLKYPDYCRKGGNEQVSDIEDNSPNLSLMSILAHKVIVDSMGDEGQCFEEDKSRHEAVDTVDVTLAGKLITMVVTLGFNIGNCPRLIKWVTVEIPGFGFTLGLLIR